MDSDKRRATYTTVTGDNSGKGSVTFNREDATCLLCGGEVEIVEKQ